MGEGSGKRRRARGVWPARSRRAGNLGRDWGVSRNGLDAGRPADRVLGRRQTATGRGGRQRRSGDPVPDRRYARDRRCGASADRGGTGDVHDQDAALGDRLARWPDGGVRDARQAVDRARSRRHRDPPDARWRRVGAVPELVAGRADDRVRWLERCRARPGPRSGGRRRKPTHRHHGCWPLSPPALLA